MLLDEAEICYFDDSVLQEDVGWFEVPMKIAMLVHPAVTLIDLPEQRFELFLCKLSVGLELAGQVAIIAVFSNDVAVVQGGEGSVAAQQVRMVETLYALQFAIEHVLSDVIS